MAKSWFLYNGPHHCDGPYNPDNYCVVKVQPDCVCGSDVCSIYADEQVTCCKIRPIITRDLEGEIAIAKLISRPSDNVRLKPC